MEYEKMSRRELQALCKKNKIPANTTNLSMASSLSILISVEGLEDVLNTDLTSLDSPSKTVVKESAPRTSCRTSTRRKPISELPPQSTQISTRARCGTRRAPVASVDLVSRKMDSQLKEAAEDERKGEETPAAVAVSRRRPGTSVRQACSTRRSTRLLEKQMIGMNLDDDEEEKIEGDVKVVKELTISVESVVNDQEMGVEEGDVKVVKELTISEESVVNDQEMGVEGDVKVVKELIISVESAAIDQDMGVEVSVAGTSQQKKPCDFQEKTDSYDEKTNILPEASLVGDNNEVDNSIVDLQQMSEVLVDDKDTAESHAKIVEDSEKCSENLENTLGVEHESDKSHGYSELANTESVINVTTEESFEDTREYESASFDQHKVGKESNEAKDSIVNLIGEEKNKLESEEKLALYESVTEPINKEEAELEESMGTAVITQVGEEMSISSDEKSDQPMIVFETEGETCLVKCDQIAQNADGKDNLFSDAPTKEEKMETHNIPDINKENFVKEQIEKVKVANKDTSLRQLKKMLKQLKISDKNTNHKEDNNMARVGKTRPALQTLSSNCLVTNECEDGN